jgi:hypothetical protein
MLLTQLLKQWILFTILSGAFYVPLMAQEGNEITYDHITDTLLIINDKVIDQYKVIMNRQELIQADTLKINQKGIWVSSFKMSAITLGQDIILSSNSALFSNEMITEIINGETKYKFIYLKDIILQSKDGRFMSPSTKSIKIIFSN